MKEFHVKEGPYLSSSNRASNIMNNLLIALIPIILFSFYENGIVPYNEGKIAILDMFMPLIMILVSILVTFLTEYLYFIIVKKEPKSLKYHFKTKYSIFPGIFLALILPTDTPIWLLALGAFITSMIGKIAFGGLGNNTFNPALVGKLFVVVIYAAALTGFNEYLNAYEIDTMLKNAPFNNYLVGSYETVVAPYGNLWNFFIGSIPGILGGSALLCLIGFVYLIYKKAIKWRIPLTYIVTVFVMSYIIGILSNVGLWYPVFQILTGGLFFGAIFMATDPVTSPTTPVAQVIYGIFLGILTIVFRYFIPVSSGVLASILIMNIFVVILDRLGAISRFGLKKTAILILAQIILVLGLPVCIASVKKIDYDNTSLEATELESYLNNYVVNRQKI